MGRHFAPWAWGTWGINIARNERDSPFRACSGTEAATENFHISLTPDWALISRKCGAEPRRGGGYASSLRDVPLLSHSLRSRFRGTAFFGPAFLARLM